MTNAPETSRQWRAVQTDEASLKRDLVLTEEPVPSVNPGEVLVKIRAVALNFTELMILGGAFPAAPRVVLCSDMAGDVIALGEGVTNVKLNDRVSAGRILNYMEGFPNDSMYAYSSGMARDGMLAEYKVLPAESLVTLPEHLSYEEASTLSCVGVTAFNCVQGGLRKVEKDDTVLVLGTGGISLFAAQFARALGAQVIFTTSSDAKAEKLKALGYLKPINYKTNPEWHKEVLRMTNGRGVQHVIENGGMGTLTRSIASCEMGSWIHMTGFLDEKSTTDNLSYAAIMRSVTLRGVFCGPATLFREMNAFITDKQLRPVVDKVFEFEQVKEAYEYLATRGSTLGGDGLGKVVIRVG